MTTIVPLNPGTISVIGNKDGVMNLQAAPTLTQQGAWVLSGQVIDTSGRPAQVPAIPACLGTNYQACAAWMARFHFRELISYEPAGRFCPLPVGRDRDFLALALALAGLCIGWLIRQIA